MSWIVQANLNETTRGERHPDSIFETGDRMSETDYVIVGAGSAGCALAARLTEDPEVHVTVLEAGGPDTAEALFMPPAWPTLWGTEVDWAYETTPQPGSSGQVHQWPRERVLGGSSSINGMVYIRGNPKDFDAWAYEGNTGWDYASLLPVMKRIENVPCGNLAYRGVCGPIEPGLAARPNPISVAFVDARARVGLSHLPTTATASASRALASTTSRSRTAGGSAPP
jgi:choline dehydrogenase